MNLNNQSYLNVLVLRSLAWIFNWELVLLTRSIDTGLHLTRIQKIGSVRYCFVYWLCKVGYVVLNDNGTCGNGTQATYIKTWSYYRKKRKRK